MSGPLTHHQEGDHASRPAANAGCVLYACTDHGLIYLSDGSSWTTWATLGGGTPDAHAASHESGGSDEIDVTGLTGAGGGGVTFAGVHAVKTASFPTLTTGVLTTLAFDGTDAYDTDAFHDPASNNSRLTVPSGKDGTYQPWSKVEFATNGTGYRRQLLMKNGSGVHLASAMAHATVGMIQMVFWPPIALVATDFLEVQAAQASGGNLATADQQFGMYLLPGS